MRCTDCSLLFLNPQPSDEELGEIYTANYFLGEGPESCGQTAAMKRATARLYLAEIKRYTGLQCGRLLEVGCGEGDFLLEAERLGYQVTGVEISSDASAKAQTRLSGGKVICGEVEDVTLEKHSFDVCVLADVIEHVRNPVEFLRRIHGLLKPKGAIFIATPSLDSWSARLMKQRWMEFKPEHLTYFDPQTLQTALAKAGYDQVVVRPGRKMLNFEYITRHFERFRVPFFTPAVRAVHDILPKSVRSRNRPVVASGMMVMARSAFQRKRQKLSIVIPAYNEAATFEALIEGVLRKEIRDLDTEIVIVESNSGDGTREIAMRYANHPRVTLVLQDKPRGKGYAVRAGLQSATGDFVLIQDADLEYDLEDYDALLEPLVEGREAFVLGSRHMGSVWKMRQFAGKAHISFALNAGHWFFTTLVNVLFKQRLKDPFTMFKVFRRDCLFGLTFEANRFDFDYELLIKLLRKGYRPLELPVNYRSRSFDEGKKVSVFRDPLTWLAILAKLRFARIDPMREIEQSRANLQAAQGS